MRMLESVLAIPQGKHIFALLFTEVPFLEIWDCNYYLQHFFALSYEISVIVTDEGNWNKWLCRLDMLFQYFSISSVQQKGTSLFQLNVKIFFPFIRRSYFLVQEKMKYFLHLSGVEK